MRGCKRRVLQPGVAGAWLSEAPGKTCRASRLFGHRPRTTSRSLASDSVAGKRLVVGPGQPGQRIKRFREG